MSLFVSLLLNNILPAMLVVGLGVVLDRALKVDKKTLSRLGIYVLVPSLVFHSVINSEIAMAQFGQLVLFMMILTVLLVSVSLGVAKALRWPTRLADALVLSVSFFNAGNLGLPVILFAFGQDGFQLAAAVFVASNFLGNTVAAFFALRGNGKGKKALLDIVKLPGPYAFAAAILLRSFHIELPGPLLKSVTLVSQAAVPMMLMMLGVQLSQTRLGARLGQVSVAVLLRLVVGAALATGLAGLIGLQGLPRSVAIILASTPTAVTSGLMAIEFEADADYVGSAILVSTLLSAVTLTLVLQFIA